MSTLLSSVMAWPLSSLMAWRLGSLIASPRGLPKSPPTFAKLPPEIILNIMEQTHDPLDLKNLCNTSFRLRFLFLEFHKQLVESTLNSEILQLEQDFEVVIMIIWVQSKRKAVRSYRISEPYETVLGPMKKLELRCQRYKEIEAIADIASNPFRHLEGYSPRVIQSGKFPVRELYIGALCTFVQIMISAKRVVADQRCDCRDALQHARLHFVLRALMTFEVNQLLALANIITLARRTMTPEVNLHYDKIKLELGKNEMFGMLCDDQCSREWWTPRLLAYIWLLVGEHKGRKLLFMGALRDVALATRAKAFEDVVTYRRRGSRQLFKVIRPDRMSVEALWEHASRQVALALRTRENE